MSASTTIPLSILICDPNAQKSANLQKILQDLGHPEVKYVDDAQKLSLAAAHVMPDLIILGNDFRDFLTSDLVRQLKKAPLLASIPLFLYAEDPSDNFLDDVLRLGVATQLKYPASEPSVRELIEAYHGLETSPKLISKMQETPFFRGCTRDELLEILRCSVARRFKPGETIIDRGDVSTSFFVLLEGEAEVIVFNDTRGTLAVPIRPGNAFGEVGILDSQERSAWCLAGQDCFALQVGASILSSPDQTLTSKLYKQLARVLATRLRAMRKVLDEEMAGSFSSSRVGIPRDDAPKKEVETKASSQRDVEVTDATPASAQDLLRSPLAAPTAIALERDTSIADEEEYEVLIRKIELRMEFLHNKISETISKTIRNKLYGYFTGTKLAKHNPHKLWNPELFLPKSTQLKYDMHLVVVCPFGEAAYKEVFFGLPFSHRIVGMKETGCSGTFLGSGDAVERFLTAQSLTKALVGDLALPIHRLFCNNPTIEFLSHSMADVRPETLFLIYEDKDGTWTQKVREVFPEHQIITAVRGIGYKESDPRSIFTEPEKVLQKEKLFYKKEDFTGKGFYEGQTFFLPDLSNFYEGNENLEKFGSLFGLLGVLATMGPDYSGRMWGTQGGSRGAMRAARARYGLKGAMSASELADAIDWADQ